MMDLEHELRAAIEERVSGLSAPSDLAERARRAGERRRRMQMLAVAGVTAGTVAAVAAVPFLIPSKTMGPSLDAPLKPTRTAVGTPPPAKTASVGLCGSGAKWPDPLPGLEVTYLPKGTMRPGGPIGGADPRRHMWMYGARFMFPSGLPAMSVEVVCGPVAHDLRALSQWPTAYGMRSTVVRGKPGLRHDSRAYEVMWIERPDIAIWVETSRDLGGQLNAIVNGIKVTG